MAAVLMHTAFVAIAAVLGALVGWFIRGSDRAKESPASDAARRAAPTAEPNPPTMPDEATMQTLVSRLQQLTESVAADVGVHHHRVQKINDELTAAAPAEVSILTAVKSLIRANETMQSQLSTAEVRLQTQAQEIERHVREARTDALTKLGNRRVFEEELNRAAVTSQQQGRTSCLMVLDLDRFKKFNDTYGHPAGDEVLRGVARVLREILLSDEIVCRHGGEEFSIIFPGSGLDRIKAQAERLRQAISREVFEFEGLDLRLTVSSGLAEFQPGEPPEKVFKRCDEALYEAKHAGRNCGYWHDGKAVHRLAEPNVASRSQPESIPAPAADGPAAEPVDADTREIADADPDPFMANLDRRIAEWKRGGSTVSVALLELDGLPKLTAELGEAGMQTALRAVSQFLRGSLREMDHAAPLRAGLFGLLLPGVSLPEAGETVERIRTEIARSGPRINHRHIALTVSAGLAEATHGDERTELLARAESSLSAAQKAGGNCSFLSSKDEKSAVTR